MPNMRSLLILCALQILAVSSFHSPAAQSRTNPTSFRYINTNRLSNIIQRTHTNLLSTTNSPDTDNEIKTETIKLENVIQIEPLSEVKKVEEWRDPVAVAAANKGPLDDIFPGG